MDVMRAATMLAAITRLRLLAAMWGTRSGLMAKPPYQTSSA